MRANSFLLSNLVVVLLISLIPFSNALAAACCGGAGALPSVITGDEKILFNGTILQSDLHVRVTQDGVWRKQSALDRTQTLRLDYAQIIQDRFQVGFSVPVTQRQTGTKDSSSGLGDINLQGGYEYLPDWDYNLYRPKGIGYLVLSFPTGRSKYETVNLSETRGKGFASIGMGTVLTKQWSMIDALLGFEVRRGFSRSFESNAFAGNLIPQWGRTLSVGAGYHIQEFRTGAMISWNDEDSKQIITDQSQEEDAERFASGSVSLSYSSANQWSANITYTDQTLFGDPTNTTLSKTLSLSFQNRWAR
jgi:hypothetical protein